MLSVALGILIAVGVLLLAWALLAVAAAAYILLWHGIDDYGPLKHAWKRWRDSP